MYFCSENLLHKCNPMKMTSLVAKQYTQEQLSAQEAQHLAHEIAFAPVVFQVSRLMVKFGILEALFAHPEGLTQEEIAQQTQTMRK